MRLNLDQKQAIKTILQQLGITQSDLANRIGLKPSALSDAIRSNSGRAIPDAKFRLLIDVLDEEMSSRSESDDSTLTRSRKYLETLKVLQSSEDENWLPPGRPIPSDSNQFIGAVTPSSTAKELESSSWIHHMVGPKMGATTLAELYESVAKFLNYSVVFPRFRGSREQRNELNLALSHLFELITGNDAFARELRSVQGFELGRKFRRGFRQFISDRLRIEPQKPILIIIDRIDSFLGDEINALEYYDFLGILFWELESEYRQHVKIVSFSLPITTPSGIGGPLRSLEFLNATSRTGTATPANPDEIRRLGKVAMIAESSFEPDWVQRQSCGNYFLLHVLLHMLKECPEKSTSEVSQLTRSLLGGENIEDLPAALAGIPVAIRQYKTSVLHALRVLKDIYEENTKKALGPNFESYLMGIVSIGHAQGNASSKTAPYLHECLVAMGLIFIDGNPGLNLELFKVYLELEFGREAV